MICDNCNTEVKELFDVTLESNNSIEVCKKCLDRLKKNKFICIFCEKKFIGYGNNPEPCGKGLCCDRCNSEIVMPARLIKHNKEMIDFGYNTGSIMGECN